MRSFKGGCAVVGAQFGSEGKGVVVRHIADQYEAHVRTGGPNAGHTFAYEGKSYKLQQLPVGFTNPAATLYIGPGATLDLATLNREVEMVEADGHRVRGRIIIDQRAAVLTKRHHATEGGVDGDLHSRIGSTGEGVGACRLDRIHRNANTGFHQAGKVLDLPYAVSPDISGLLEAHGRVLLEGTQGFGLSLVHGSWPHVTSHDTTAGTLAADAGLPPTRLDRVVVVARTYPIRVAGASGPLPGELTWAEMSKRAGREVEERTTVTKKIRRIGEFDIEQVIEAVRVNGGTEIALTFLDYLDPANHMAKEFSDLTSRTQAFVEELEYETDCPVTLLGTGYDDVTGWSVIERGAQ